MESVLPKLCSIISTDYTPGTFSKFEDQFNKSRKTKDYFRVIGTESIRFTITLEEYEGYFFADLVGKGKCFQSAKEYLWDCYISSGGNPSTQEKP